MKKLLTVFVLLALVLVAAPFRPILSIDANNPPTFTVAGADPSALYEINGSNGQNGTLFTESWSSSTNYPLGLKPDSSGTIQGVLGAFFDPGDWTFELHKIGNNGTAMHRVLDSVSVTY